MLANISGCVEKSLPPENIFYTLYSVVGNNTALLSESKKLAFIKFTGKTSSDVSTYFHSIGGECRPGISVMQCVFFGDFSRMVYGPPPLSTAVWDIRLHLIDDKVVKIDVLVTTFDELNHG